MAEAAQAAVPAKESPPLVSREAEIMDRKEDLDEYFARVTLFTERLRPDDKVTVRYPENNFSHSPDIKRHAVNYGDERLTVKVNDVIYFNEELPDTIIEKKCKWKVQNPYLRKNESKIKVKLAKEKHGFWEDRWHSSKAR